MKKLLLMLTLAVLLAGMSSCSERPIKLDLPEETSETGKKSDPPPKTYLEALEADLGYQDYPDSILCYTDPLMEYNVLPFEYIHFTAEEPDERFISYNYTYELQLVHENDVFTATQPNANYLTRPDGTRQKLCPYQTCRDDLWEACSHLSLAGGVVYGDFVYFSGANRCVGWKDHPNRDGILEVNMILRYDIAKNTVEKVMYTNGTTRMMTAKYGVLFFTVDDNLMCMELATGETAFVPDENRLIRKMMYPLKYEETQFYYDEWDGETCTIYAAEYDMSEVSLHRQFTVPEELAGGSVSLTDSGIYLMQYQSMDEKSWDFTLSRMDFTAASAYDLWLIDENGNPKLLLENLAECVIASDCIYAAEYENRAVFTTPFIKTEDNRFLHEFEEYYTVSGVTNAGTLMRYEIQKDGTLADGEAVFTEGADTRDAEEYLEDIQAYGDAVRVYTLVPFDDSEDSPDREYFTGFWRHWRTYIVTADEVVQDSDMVTERLTLRKAWEYSSIAD